MTHAPIDVHSGDGITTITLTRPERHNALNTELRAALTGALQKAARNTRVIVITGTGRAFCSGQDLVDGTGIDSAATDRILREEYIPMLHAITRAPVPVIAAVNGVAAGAGASLALACDVVIATHSARFIQAFTRIGLIPDAGGTWFLPRLVGHARAMGLALFSDEITAPQAREMGMIWESVPDAEFDAHWKARAAQLAKGPTLAFAGVKRALQAAGANDLDSQLAIERQEQSDLADSRDFREGIDAFIKKRPACFYGQ